MNTPKDSHYARLRRQFREIKKNKELAGLAQSKRLSRNASIKTVNSTESTKLLLDSMHQTTPSALRIYGIHSVNAVLQNPRRHIHRLFVTKNALTRLVRVESDKYPLIKVTPKELNKLVGGDCVHQGVVVETEPLKVKNIADLSSAQLVLVLDQITDPHNVGAIMRSAVAFNVNALITTYRHSPQETAVLAKAASGAIDNLDHITVRNLATTLEELKQLGFQTLGLDSEAQTPLHRALEGKKIALVLGSEGKGLRQKTRTTVDRVAHLEIPGKIKSLNVSNAAAIALYATQTYLADL